MTLTLRERAELASLVRLTAEMDPAVVGLTVGPWGAATHYPGGKIDGVVIRDNPAAPEVEVHLVVSNPYVRVAGDRVMTRVAQAITDSGYPAAVQIVIEDLELPSTVLVIEDPEVPRTAVVIEEERWPS